VWKWRMRLFEWEEEQVGELCLLLQNVTLQVEKEDKWLWSYLLYASKGRGFPSCSLCIQGESKVRIL